MTRRTPLHALPWLLTAALMASGVGSWAAAQTQAQTRARAQAQPLAQLAPAESFLTLGFSPSSAPAISLGDDLAALDWPRAGRTLENLGALSGDPSLREMLGVYGQAFQGMDGQGRKGPGKRGMKSMGGSRFARCLERNASEDVKTLENVQGAAWQQALLTVGASSYSPIPAATALVRVAPAFENEFTELQRLIVTCSERVGSEVARLREGDTPLLVIGNASDFPVVLSRVGSLFVVGSNPETVRGVVRRAHGSAEPNFSTTPFYRQNRALLGGPGMSLALNAAALGNLVESLGANFADPQTEPLLTKLVGSLRTLGSYAGTLRFVGQELRLESQLSVNPAGGDAELAELLLCSCPAPDPTLAPDDSYAVSTAYTEPQKVFAYLQNWADTAGRASGETLDLRQLAQQELGLDLDTALFDWLGNESTSVVLEPTGTDLEPLLYGPHQVYALETRGEAAARAGLDELGSAVERLLAEQDYGETDADVELFFQSATEHYDFGGVAIERVRFGPNIDIGVAFLDDTLLLGMPAEAIEAAISAAQGYATPLSEDEAFRAARAAMPEAVTKLGYSVFSDELRGLSDLTRLASQPLAFVGLAGLSELSSPEAGRKGGTRKPAAQTPTFADLLHLTDLLPNALEVFADHTGTFSSYSWVEGNHQRSATSLELK